MKRSMALFLAALMGLAGCAGMAEGGTGEGLAMRFTPCVDPATGMLVGRCLAPANFTVQSETEWCGALQSAAAPARVSVSASSPDGRAAFLYASRVEFIHHLEHTMGGVPYKAHVDGQFDAELLSPMLAFHYADAFADFLISSLFPGVQITLESQGEISSADQALMDSRANALYAELNKLLGSQPGVTIDGAYYGVVERTYSFINEGEPCLATVLTATQAQQMTMRAALGYGAGDVVDTTIGWASPFAFLFVASAEEYAAYRAAFDLFAQNTTVSNEFIAAFRALSSQLVAYMSERNLQSMQAVRDYCQRQLSGSLSSGAASYDSTDAWSDCIYDQHDYTLADGNHIKVSTAYDYVYSDGTNVYATNNALDIPVAMTPLSPN